MLFTKIYIGNRFKLLFNTNGFNHQKDWVCSKICYSLYTKHEKDCCRGNLKGSSADGWSYKLVVLIQWLQNQEAFLSCNVDHVLLVFRW